MKAEPHIAGAHKKAIEQVSRRLARHRELMEKAEQERNQLIRDAFAAGLTARQVAAAAGISDHRAYQIAHNRR